MISVNHNCHHKSKVIPRNRQLLKFFYSINKRELLLFFVIQLILLKEVIRSLRSHLGEIWWNQCNGNGRNTNEIIIGKEGIKTLAKSRSFPEFVGQLCSYFIVHLMKTVRLRVEELSSLLITDHQLTKESIANKSTSKSVSRSLFPYKVWRFGH